MKCLIALPLLFLQILSLSAQTEKGAMPLTTNSQQPKTGVTRAVIIGISEYQDEKISDLQYAHRDAEAFAAWLRSPAGGNVPDKNLVLLTNTDATLGGFITALDGLIANAQEGDQVIVYFSGHGDVEGKYHSQPGYLLCHDTKAAVYMAGAFNVRDFQEVINTLALQNKAKVLIITDACHAGKLAGNSINGTQLTSANLAKQFANETKFLSCQPNEFSLEGSQWGGGRGVFSYFLVEGLSGMADRNNDGLVSLFELDMYLVEKVPEETAPHRQFPVAIGDKTSRMARVDAPTLAALRQAKTNAAPQLAGTEMKGWEDDIVAAADSATQALYYAYKAALEHGALIDSAAEYASAWALLPQLLQRESLRELHGLLRRNLAAALIDEVQQALNALMTDDPYEANNWRYNPEKYEKYPSYLQHTIELLGEGHYMQRSMQSKLRYFEGYLFARKTVDMSEASVRDSLREVAKRKYLEAATLEPGAAYIYHAIGTLYAINNPARTDSMLVWHNKALEYAPSWKLPYLDLSYEYQISLSDLSRAEYWLNKALEQDQDSYVVLERLSWLYQWQNRIQESLVLCDTMIARKPELFNAYSTKGVTYMMRNEYPEAAACFRRSIELEPGLNNWAVYYQATLLTLTRRWPESKSALDKALLDKEMDNFLQAAWLFHTLAPLFFQNKITEAKPYFEQLIESQTYPARIAAGLAGLGVIFYKNGKLQEADTFLLKSLEADPTPSAGTLMYNTYRALIAQKRKEPGKTDSLFQVAFKSIQNISALEISFAYADCRLAYGKFLMQQKRYAEARDQFRLAEEFQPRCYQAQYGYALLAAFEKRHNEALDYLEKALDYWLPEPALILEEPLFAKIRKTKRFKELMAKHFPPGWEDR